jgi:hypothetical protein
VTLESPPDARVEPSHAERKISAANAHAALEQRS